jgi:hypothetical protein
MKRDLKRERAIAKAAGPLSMWRPPPDRAPPVRAREAREWLRRAEAELAELEASPLDPDHPGPGPEFGGS